MDDERTATRVGAAVLVAIGLAVVLVLTLQGQHLVRGVRLHVQIESVGNLQVGAKVRLAGLELGEVTDIRLTGGPTRALLDLWIDRRRASLLTTTTDFFLSQEGLLGEPYLGVAGRPGAPGPALPDGATVRGIDPPRIDRLLHTVQDNLRAATQLMRDGIPEGSALRRALADLDTTLDGLEPVAWAAGRRLIDEGRALSVGLPDGAMGRLGDAAAALRLPPLAARLAALSRELDRLGTAAGDPRLARFAAALADAGPVIDRAQAALKIADELRDRLLSGRGTLGALLQDVEIADEMKDMMKTMKRQPWQTLGKPGKQQD